MTRIDSWMVLVLATGFLAAASISEPWMLGDQNTFLAEFLKGDFLGFMGIIVTITLASSTSIYVHLRNQEERIGEEVFTKTKTAVRRSAVSLICVLALSLIVVVVKPLVSTGDICSSLANSAAIVLILWGLLVMLDLAGLAFKL